MTTWFACGLWFLFGAFLGIEATGYSFHQRDPKPAFTVVPQRVEPVDVFQGNCRERGYALYKSCEMAKVRKARG